MEREVRVRFRLLGAVRLEVDGSTVDLGPPKQRTVFTSLLLVPGQVVPTELLIDRVWGEAPPTGVRGALYSYITRLRRVLAHVTIDQRCPALLRHTGGYLADIDPAQVDLHQFRAQVSRARRAVQGCDDEDAAQALRDGLALWRESPLVGLSGDWAVRLRKQLAQERLGALVEYFDVRLRLGGSTELVSDLYQALAAYPTAEVLAARLMTALHRCGRHAEALACFAQMRERIGAELGVEPSTELQQLHTRILCSRPDRVTSAPAVATAPPVATAPAAPRTNLPAGSPDFAGRRLEIDRLHALATHVHRRTVPTLVTVDGMAGVGKTALVLHVANQLVGVYPRVQLFVDLRGHTPGQEPMAPVAALDTLLRCLGVPPAEIPSGLDERITLWRTELRDGGILILLDNAASAQQVRPLLPGAGHVMVLVTSRRRLTGIDGAHVVHLDPLPPADATMLFARIAGRDRTMMESGAVAEAVSLCGYLPLAIRICAVRLQRRSSWTVAHLARRLRDQQRVLTELATEDRDVATSLHLSYRQLPPGHRRMFRLVGRVPGLDFDVHVAAALAGTSVNHAEQLLEDLLDVNLLQQALPGRYRMHDLVRHYARNAAEPDESPTTGAQPPAGYSTPTCTLPTSRPTTSAHEHV